MWILWSLIRGFVQPLIQLRNQARDVNLFSLISFGAHDYSSKNISCTVQLSSLREGVFSQAEISSVAGNLWMILFLWSKGQRKGCSHLLVVVAWFKPVSEAAETSSLIETRFPAWWVLSKVINRCELDSEQLVDGEWYQETGHTVVTVTLAAPAHVLWHLLGSNLLAQKHKVRLWYLVVLTFKKWHLVFYFFLALSPGASAASPVSSVSVAKVFIAEWVTSSAWCKTFLIEEKVGVKTLCFILVPWVLVFIKPWELIKHLCVCVCVCARICACIYRYMYTHICCVYLQNMHFYGICMEDHSPICFFFHKLSYFNFLWIFVLPLAYVPLNTELNIRIFTHCCSVFRQNQEL